MKKPFLLLCLLCRVYAVPDGICLGNDDVRLMCFYFYAGRSLVKRMLPVYVYNHLPFCQDRQVRIRVDVLRNRPPLWQKVFFGVQSFCKVMLKIRLHPALLVTDLPSTLAADLPLQEPPAVATSFAAAAPSGIHVLLRCS